eukprot:6195028-Pleurochrysis_carterae.AAC.1
MLLLLGVHGIWRFWRKTLLLLRLLSLVGSFMLGIAMFLLGGDPFSLGCSISPVLIWTAFTWAFWPFLIKMYAFWRIVTSRSLQSISFEAKKVIGVFLAACFVQFAVALLFFVLAPHADRSSTVNVGFGHSYIYVKCSAFNEEGRYLYISQQLVGILAGLFFDRRTKTHAETQMQKSDQFWTRNVIYMLFLHVAFVSPALLSLNYAQLHIAALWLRALSYFTFGVSVCIAAVLPAYFYHSHVVSETRVGSTRTRDLASDMPSAAMSYAELEKEVERLTQMLQQASLAQGLELGQPMGDQRGTLREPSRNRVAGEAPGGRANLPMPRAQEVPVPTAQEVPTNEEAGCTTTRTHDADADAAAAAPPDRATSVAAATAEAPAVEATEDVQVPEHLNGSPKLQC